MRLAALVAAQPAVGRGGFVGNSRGLMQSFYRKWLVEKQPIPQTFRAAQQELRTKHPDDPHAWAGFVLVE